MKKKAKVIIKLLIFVTIIGAAVWFLLIAPVREFHGFEKELEDGAKRYYDLHSSELPTGERIKTLTLSDLYKNGIIKGTYYVPLSTKTCSVEKSWVKVKKDNGRYIYYVYMECGRFKSNIDHEGPTIKLKGKENITLSINEKFKDPGIESVVDKEDGKIDKSSVVVKGNVDTSKVGEYTITYKASDSLKNTTIVTRTINVIKYLNDFMKEDLGEEQYYKGDPKNNYARFSNMYFRIVGFTEEGNIILIAEEDVANVPYNKLEKWLDEVYMESFTKEAKKLMVKHKFCKMKIKEADLKTVTECTSYTKKRYAYVASLTDVNRTDMPPDEYNTAVNNFMKTYTMSWSADYQSSTKAYVNKKFFYPENGKKIVYYSDVKTNNYGVRPMIVVKGNINITAGDGTREDPYQFGNPKRAKGGSLLNDRYTGEYIEINGFRWIIIKTMDDGTTKIINYDAIFDYGDRLTTTSSPGGSGVYNPKDKENMGYYINNRVSKYIDTNLIVPHEIEAPIYKGIASYGEEIKTVKYKVKLSPPNSYEMFSAKPFTRGILRSYSYWLLNTSNSKKRYLGAISDTGCYLNGEIDHFAKIGVRTVGFVKKGTIITSGKGSYESPYKIK